MDDKTKNVMNTSKMFSKIRNRIKGKPLKIHLKTNKLSTEDDEGMGLHPVGETGEATPGEGLSGEDQNYGEEQQFGYYEGFNEYSQGFGQVGDEYDVKDVKQESAEINDEEEERRVARYRERARKRRDRALETGELEDGEHSPSQVQREGKKEEGESIGDRRVRRW